MSKLVLERLAAQFPADVVATETLKNGDDVATIRPEAIVAIATFLKTDPALAFEMLTDVVAVDYLSYKTEAFGGSSRASMEAPPSVQEAPQETPKRYCVNYQLYSVSKKHRVRLKALLDGEEPHLPSLTGVYKSADWGERHEWDMMGIRFDGHPNLKRMYLWEEFKGHPLRKDYPVNLRQPLVEERTFPDLVRGPGPGPGGSLVPMSQVHSGRDKDAYD